MNFQPVYKYKHQFDLIDVGRTREVINLMQAAIVRDPADDEAYYVLARAYFNEDSLVSARTYVTTAIELYQENPYYYALLGGIYTKTAISDGIVTDFALRDLAFEAYRTALEIAPSIDSIRYSLAIASFALACTSSGVDEEIFKSGISELERAHEDNPDHHIYLQTLAEVYSDTEDFQEVIRCYDRLVVLDPDNYVYYNDRGTVYLEHLDEPTKALEDFSVALKLAPRPHRNLITLNSMSAFVSKNRRISWIFAFASEKVWISLFFLGTISRLLLLPYLTSRGFISAYSASTVSSILFYLLLGSLGFYGIFYGLARNRRLR